MRVLPQRQLHVYAWRRIILRKLETTKRKGDKEMTDEFEFELTKEIIEIVRADCREINAWYKKHPNIPYEGGSK